MPWQRFLLIHALELKPDGSFRFRTVLILVARQNGKTTIIEVKNLWKMFVLGIPLVVSTAQDLDVAEESWDKSIEVIESIPDLAAELVKVNKVNGKKYFRLANGSRWKPKASTRRAGRGLSGDDVNLDELREHQNYLAWAAVTKTTMARPNAQVYAFSNAGDDQSVVLNDLQMQGRAAAEHRQVADPSFGYFEWSAPDDVKCTCKMRPHLPDCLLQQREFWAMANPSLGYGMLTEQALASALSTDPEPVFRTECLCQRVERMSEWGIFTQADWEACQHPGTEIVGRPAFAVEVDQAVTTISIGAAGRNGDGMRHLELAARFPADTGRLIGWLKKRREAHDPIAVVIDPAGPAGYLIPEVERHYGEVLKPLGRQVAGACASVFVGICGDDNARDIRVRPHQALDGAAKAAVWRSRGDAQVFDRRSDHGPDVAPVMAVTLADYAHHAAPQVSGIWAAYA